MSSLRKFIAVSALSLSSPLVTRAASYQGFVSNVAPFKGTVYVMLRDGGFDGGISSCAMPDGSMVFSVDPTTPFGRTLVATALAAKTSGKMVYAVGNATCVSGSMFYPGLSEGLLGLDLKG